MISLPQMKSLIERTLSEMGSKFASDDAVEMVLVTGIVALLTFKFELFIFKDCLCLHKLVEFKEDRSPG